MPLSRSPMREHARQRRPRDIWRPLSGARRIPNGLEPSRSLILQDKETLVLATAAVSVHSSRSMPLHRATPYRLRLTHSLPTEPLPTMAPTTRRNSTLAKKIATLQLTLAPLVPLPSGAPHPAFPSTLMAFHLLTEAELDSIAHYYHQSTPGPWSESYPASMNWDKDFLAKPAATIAAATSPRHSRRLSVQEKEFISDLLKTVEDLRHPVLPSQPEIEDEATPAKNPYAGLTDKERIRIKRRKVGKFIGLVGMETPAEEIAGRIQASLDRAVERSREELRRNEEVMLRRRKMA
ncbi:hypothetical protein LTR53_009572 [Teratosphaeriaceae sp. CCFEE 6253]|nr:hypothetical protein LTR53_009572 [Teratosphaeriaceae sp. CCFEE 6253]